MCVCARAHTHTHTHTHCAYTPCSAGEPRRISATQHTIWPPRLRISRARPKGGRVALTTGIEAIILFACLGLGWVCSGQFRLLFCALEGERHQGVGGGGCCAQGVGGSGCCTARHCAMPSCTVLCFTTLLYYTILYCTMLYYFTLLLDCTILRYPGLD